MNVWGVMPIDALGLLLIIRKVIIFHRGVLEGRLISIMLSFTISVDNALTVPSNLFVVSGVILEFGTGPFFFFFSDVTVLVILLTPTTNSSSLPSLIDVSFRSACKCSTKVNAILYEKCTSVYMDVPQVPKQKQQLQQFLHLTGKSCGFPLGHVNI